MPGKRARDEVASNEAFGDGCDDDAHEMALLTRLCTLGGADDAAARASHTGFTPAWCPPRHGAEKAALLRVRKAEVRLSAEKEALQEQKKQLQDDVSMMAELAGIHLTSGSRGAVGSVKPGVPCVPHNVWSPMKILRATFTPVSAGAFSVVMGCGKVAPNDCKSAVSWCIQEKQREAIESFFDRYDEHGLPAPTPWAIFSKMHDCTKLEVTMPEVSL